MMHQTINSLKELRYQESYALLSTVDRTAPVLFDEWEFQTDYCGLDPSGETGFTSTHADDIYRWLCHAFFPVSVTLPQSESREVGREFVRDFATGSVIRSPLGYNWRFEDRNDATHFKLRYYG